MDIPLFDFWLGSGELCHAGMAETEEAERQRNHAGLALKRWEALSYPYFLGFKSNNTIKKYKKTHIFQANLIKKYLKGHNWKNLSFSMKKELVPWLRVLRIYNHFS